MYTLIATTAGDELRGPERFVVAVSESQAKLVDLKMARAAERAAYFNDLPDYVQGSLISQEHIEEGAHLI